MPSERESRRLAAILAADAVGYSRLVSLDEEATIARLRAVQADVISPMLAQFGGRLIKTTGDGFLAEFASVVDAARCAVAIQHGVREREASVSEGRRLIFRVGINVGDVIAEGDDLLGDGVNVAARLEEIAEPGGITISGTAFDHLKGKIDLACDDLGPQQLKNIPEPVRAYRVRLGAELVPSRPAKRPWYLDWQSAAAVVTTVLLVGVGVYDGFHVWRSQPAPEQSEPSAQPAPAAERAALIVLPFTNLSGDPQEEYFNDGFTEDVTTALARIPGFQVVSRASAFQYKGRSVDAQQVGRERGVRYVLEGSVRKIGERLRLNVQLIEAAGGEHVWAERYDRPYSEIFAVQDELADKVVGSVAANLRRREGEKALAAAPERLEAYELTLRARLLRGLGGQANTLEARRILEQAIAQSPEFQPAYVQLAAVINVFFSNRWNDEFASPVAAAKMLEAAGTGVRLGPNDPLAHTTLGIALAINRQQDAAAAEIDQALRLAPNDTDVLIDATIVLLRANQYERVIEYGRKAMELDPFILPSIVGSHLGRAYYQLHQMRESVDISRFCISRVPNYISCRSGLVMALGQMGATDEAKTEIAEIMKRDPNFSIAGKSRFVRLTSKSPADAEYYLEGLRKAGVPE